jgi:hypothetical protein
VLRGHIKGGGDLTAIGTVGSTSGAR